MEWRNVLQSNAASTASGNTFRAAAEEAGILIGDAFRPAPKPTKRKR
jgi:hypothetical protein